MMKIISILLYCALALCLCACNQKTTAQPPVPTQISGIVQETAVPATTADTLTAYGEFLAGQRSANSSEGSIDLTTFSRLFTTEDIRWDVTQIAVVDLHGDGLPEAVLQISDSVGYVLLGYQDSGDLFAQGVWYREFQNLKADGSYMASGSSANLSYLQSHSSGEYLLAECWEDESGILHYTVDGKDVDEETFAAFEIQQAAKPDVVWYEDWDSYLAAK